MLIFGNEGVTHEMPQRHVSSFTPLLLWDTCPQEANKMRHLLKEKMNLSNNSAVKSCIFVDFFEASFVCLVSFRFSQLRKRQRGSGWAEFEVTWVLFKDITPKDRALRFAWAYSTLRK